MRDTAPGNGTSLNTARNRLRGVVVGADVGNQVDPTRIVERARLPKGSIERLRTGMITVHHLNRSRSFRILWLLEELALPYEVKRYQRDARTNLAPPELLGAHPLGKSPMIEIDGRIVIESAAIVELLCARHGPHLVPAPGTDAHITHLELMHFAEGSAMTPILLWLYVGTLGTAGAPLGPRIQQQLDSHFGYMEQMLRPSGHFVLDDLSAADIMLSFPAEIAMRQGRQDDYPKLAQFVAANRSRPAYAAARHKGGPD